MTFRIHSVSDAPEASRDALTKAQEQFGFVPDLMGVLAASPAALNAYVEAEEWMKKSSLSPTERAVVLKTAAQLTNCSWCTSAVTGPEDGVSPDIAKACEEDQPLPDSKLEALRQYTIGVIESQGRPSDEVKNRFIAAGYGPQQALEIVLGVGLRTLSALTASLAHSALDARLQQ